MKISKKNAKKSRKIAKLRTAHDYSRIARARYARARSRIAKKSRNFEQKSRKNREKSSKNPSYVVRIVCRPSTVAQLRRYNDAHHYRAENPLSHLHEDEAPVETDKLKSARV